MGGTAEYGQRETDNWLPDCRGGRQPGWDSRGGTAGVELGWRTSHLLSSG